MRFLLHPSVVTKATKRLLRKNKPKNSTTWKKVPSQLNDKTSNNMAWGQQCSPHCGCILRFECALDDATQIVEASYTAKSLVVNQQGTVGTTMTTTSNKLLLRPCTCSTLHTLAERVIDFLPTKPLAQLSNQMEFSGIRSSLATRHVILQRHRNADVTSKNAEHCYDLVEEALTAMIKGYMPSPRKQQNYYHAILANSSSNTDDDVDSMIMMEDDSLRQQTSYESSSSIISIGHVPRAMSALSMFDVNEQQHNIEKTAATQERFVNKKLRTASVIDWVSYVDELYERQENEEQQSA